MRRGWLRRIGSTPPSECASEGFLFACILWWSLRAEALGDEAREIAGRLLPGVPFGFLLFELVGGPGAVDLGGDPDRQTGRSEESIHGGAHARRRLGFGRMPRRTLGRRRLGTHHARLDGKIAIAEPYRHR